MPAAAHKDQILKGEQLFTEGNLEEALTVFEEVLEEVPENANALNDAGLTAHELGLFVDAATYYERALEARPGHAGAFFNLIDLLVDEGEADLAREAFRTYQSNVPDSEEKQKYQEVLFRSLKEDKPSTQIPQSWPAYYSLLSYIHDTLRPETYVEIGVQSGISLALASPTTRSVGIDPDLQLRVELPESAKLFEQTSDAFFESHNLYDEFEEQPVDLAFIDGMHLFEYALRDFINLEKHCDPQSVILIHDCYPISAETASRERTTQMWSGDIWKLILCLKKYRPDLHISTADVAPTGLGIITHLDPQSTVLQDNLDTIISEYVSLDYSVLERNKDGLLNRIDGTFDRINDLLLFGRPELSIPQVTVTKADQSDRCASDDATVSILMPTTDRPLAIKTAEILRNRAGMDCEIYILEDEQRKGLVWVLNEAIKHIRSDYYVFLAQDVFPARDWLKIAYEQMQADQAGLLGFNDGKWGGHHAAYGMVERDWLLSVYNGDFFYPGYHSHAGDTELTIIARQQGKYTFNLNAILMEVDYYKDYKGVNLEDKQLFLRRKASGFDGRITSEEPLSTYQ